jgi:hypothetical protein
MQKFALTFGILVNSIREINFTKAEPEVIVAHALVHKSND